MLADFLLILFYVLLFNVFNSDPRLTTRNDDGHMPVRVVMSQSMNLTEVAHLWDTFEVYLSLIHI